MSYTEEEVCVILEGRVRLTDLQGNAKEFFAGSTFDYMRILNVLGKR